jgi:hypothetical protein
MNNNKNIVKELSSLEYLPWDELPNTFIKHSSTPAHKFVSVASLMKDDQSCLEITARDYFDPKLASASLGFILDRESSLNPEIPFTIFDGFSVEDYAFDSVCVLSPTTAARFVHQNEFLNERSYSLFPIHRCELSGDETSETLETIRRYFLDSLAWDRTPEPQIRWSFLDTKTKWGTKGKKIHYCSFKDVLNLIKEGFEGEGSWIKLENFQKQLCRIEWKEKSFHVELPNKPVARVGKKMLREMLSEYVCPQRYSNF